MRCQKSKFFEHFRNLQFRKKAQITLFIILGLVIFAGIGLLLYYNSRIVEEGFIPEIAKTEGVSVELQPIKSYVEACLIEKAVEGLEKLGDRGGYIEPEKHGLIAGGEPTDSDLVEFAPGSELKVPYWYYLKSDNKCTGGCEFKTVPQNELVLHRERGKLSIEGQLDEYIEETLLGCLADFKVFKDQGFVINVKGEIEVTTKVAATDIQFYVNYPLEIERNSMNELEHYYVVVPLNLEKIYQQAVTITNLQGQFKFLERDALNLIEGFTAIDTDRLPPMSDSTFHYGKIVTWKKSAVKKKIQEMLSTYIQLLQVYGSENYNPYDFPDDALKSSLYNAGMLIPSNETYEGLSVFFNYISFWDPIYFDLNCRGELCQPESVGNPFLNFMGIQRYEFVYDVSFPTLVEIHDAKALNNKGYDFKFFLEANIRNNQPMQADFDPILAPDITTGSMLCDENKRNSGNITLTVTDSEGVPLDGVQVTYTCTGESCYMGETENGEYKGPFPICLGGMVGYIKDDYLGVSQILTTKLDTDKTLDEVQLQKKKDMPFILMKKRVIKNGGEWQFENIPMELAENEEALISITRIGAVEDEDFTTMADYKSEMGNGSIKIAPGEYDIDIQLMTYGDLVIPEREEEIDTGLFSSDTVEYPEVKFDVGQYPSGGLRITYEFKKEDLEKDRIIFYVVNPDITGIPESDRVLDDLNKMNAVEEYSEEYKARLIPRFE